MRRTRLADMLRGGDRRSIGKANPIAKLVLSEPTRVTELFKCLWDENPVVRMRAADAAEKITVTRPELWNPHKKELLGLLEEAEQIELRWHMALMVPRLELNASERQRAAATLQRDRKSTRLNSSHLVISYAVFCLKKKKKVNEELILIRKKIYKRSSL